MQIPRNQSAPHFVLANRNMSTAQLAPLPRVGSNLGYQLGSGSLRVQEGGGSGSVIVRPLSRKDIFYSRSIYSVAEVGQAEKPTGLRSNRQSYVSVQSGLR